MTNQYLIILFSILGFYISFYIYKTKKNNKFLICPLKADCNTVINSFFSKFLGINVEFLGMIYYILIFLIYLFYIIYQKSILILDFFIFKISFLGFLFSLYLTLIQVFKIRKFCSWCLLAAFFSFLIFINSYIIYKPTIELIVFNFKWLSVFFHALFSGIGLGIIIVVDYLFFKFLKDKKIDENETKILDYLSDLIWLILLIIFLSGTFIYLADMDKYHQSIKFQFKMIVFIIIIINGIILNLFISPKLNNFNFEKLSYKELGSIFSGIVSFISWLLAFILGRLKNIPFDLNFWAISYFSLLFLILVFSIIIFKFFKKSD